MASGKLFGRPCWNVDGKAIGCRVGEALVFKLGDPAHAEALALDGAEPFDPSGKRRPMREWVVVPEAHAARWPELARAALAHRTA